MPIGKTLVSYHNITKPFPDTGKQLAQARQAAGKVIPDPAKADARVAQLATGFDKLREAQGNFPRVMHTPRDVSAALLQTHLAHQANQENKLESFFLKGIETVLEAFDVQFSPSDWLGWMLSFFTWIEDIVPAGFPAAPEAPAAVANDFSIAVVGDWGTGLYGAPACAQSIQADTDGYNLLLHLGDVYYSGLAEEIQERFIPFWPNVPGAISRSLNGNHEMYTGGHAYFELLLPKLQQTSSYFAFQNDHWILVALDSAYTQPFGGQEGDLNQQQVDWLRKIIAAAGNRKIVLFSHHQPFSLLDSNQGPKLITWLHDFLNARQIFAWYWGHEHRCVLYDEHPAYGLHGRCVGHGGFPEIRRDFSNAPISTELGSSWRKLDPAGDVPGGLVLDSNNLWIPGFETQFAPHGFMRLHFHDEHLTEYVRAPDGANLYFEDLA